MNAFDAVIFDYDGTLFETRGAITHCMRRAFEECRRPLPAAEQIKAAVKSGLPLQDTLIAIDQSLHSNAASLAEIASIYRKLYVDEGTPLLWPYPGVGEVLRKLHVWGIKSVVVSNKGIAAIRRSLDANQLSQFIDVVFGDAPGLPRKPDPAIVVRHILPRFSKLKTQRILIVGDTEIDIMFARRCGAHACWASYGYGEAELCRSLEPDYEISSIDAVLALVHG